MNTSVKPSSLEESTGRRVPAPDGQSVLGLAFRQYLRFAASGALAIGTYIALFALFRTALPLPLWATSGGSYLLATGLNYWLNYHWSFASKDPHHSALPRYAVIACASVSLNAAIVPLLVHSGLSPSAAGFAFAITWPVLPFFAQKYWAFKGD